MFAGFGAASRPAAPPTGAASAREATPLSFRVRVHSFSASSLPPSDSDAFVVWQLPGLAKCKTIVKKACVTPVWTESWELDFQVRT